MKRKSNHTGAVVGLVELVSLQCNDRIASVHGWFRGEFGRATLLSMRLGIADLKWNREIETPVKSLDESRCPDLLFNEGYGQLGLV